MESIKEDLESDETRCVLMRDGGRGWLVVGREEGGGCSGEKINEGSAPPSLNRA
jgi:hypothetical protein